MLDLATVRAFLDDRHRGMAKRLATFIEDHLVPLPEAADDESARRQARTILEALGAAGWLHPILDQDLRALALIREALATVSPLADAVMALQALGSTPIVLAGTDALKRRWLSPMAAGKAMAAFAMTEPEAGSDVAAMTTTITRDGSQYVLNGRKTLISNAGLADFYTVFATTDPSLGSDGIACAVVPSDAPGLEFVGPQVLSAPHPLGEIAFVDCRIERVDLLADAGHGFKLGLRTLDCLRATVGAAACGMAGRALEEALAHAAQRRQFGQPLAQFQLIQQKLAIMAIDLMAARLLVYRAAWESDGGAERVTIESAAAKAYATEAAQRIVDSAVQILGGSGVLADHPVDRLYRAVRALRIYEGTTEVQYLTVARHVLRPFRARVAGE